MKRLFNSWINVAFPEICVCCGGTVRSGRLICLWCEKERFETPAWTDRDILPENLSFVYSMWGFDKGGYLQDTLHKLKYEFLSGVGEELGEILGRAFKKQSEKGENGAFTEISPLLVPVPLHRSKLRKRGYNQAMAIAKGVNRVTGWDVTAEGDVIRTRKTASQTGLSLAERAENLKNAFEISEVSVFKNRFPVIVDDVFTTGATTFELASAIEKTGGGKVGVLTVAGA